MFKDEMKINYQPDCYTLNLTRKFLTTALFAKSEFQCLKRIEKDETDSIFACSSLNVSRKFLLTEVQLSLFMNY